MSGSTEFFSFHNVSFLPVRRDLLQPNEFAVDTGNALNTANTNPIHSRLSQKPGSESGALQIPQIPVSVRLCRSCLALSARFLRPDIRKILALVFLCFLSWNPASAQGENDQIKATFLFHFTQFITWPTDDPPDAGQPVSIAILEAESVAQALEEIVKEQRVNGHPVEVLRIAEVKEAERAKILFIPGEKVSEQKKAIEQMGGRSILLVSETRNFLEKGGMISLLSMNKEEPVLIAINQEALKRAGLKASARLLRLVNAERDAK